jgi:hypothetical protein
LETDTLETCFPDCKTGHDLDASLERIKLEFEKRLPGKKCFAGTFVISARLKLDVRSCFDEITKKLNAQHAKEINASLATMSRARGNSTR